eukprot:CAMPEP_0204826918 /NCGR_PEP_ID=MMETSP1346-20131115/4514_1 /ASSEMBLY_ACC=CAM_ASM_000771 /TAXON_ID=215587 /ORGANISM="Aplanochytrium stocchinoi, Strain GSBS06" /LENGTH=499 /DNA_ID=CAMNT_0051955153 /DNA_START=120 /DNA_END=1619 /DNA_ORIENTATION=+
MNQFLCLIFVVVATTALGIGTAREVPNSRVNVLLLGASGNLAEKYLWQGFYNIHTTGLRTGDEIHVYPAATKNFEKANPILQRILVNNITTTDEEHKKQFLANNVSPYTQLRSDEQYKALGEKIKKDTIASGKRDAGLLVYMSVPPKFFGSISQYINDYLRPSSPDAWLRVIVEKPFGVNLMSAKDLAETLYKNLDVKEILLVDHYMGKQGLDAIRQLRKANPEFDKAFLNKNEVSKVEVAMLETEDCKGRTGFYDEVGVIRDTMQNHLMMMVALLGMDLEHADKTEADARRAVFDKLQTAAINDILHLAQYEDYNNHVNEDRAKWDEPLLDEPSKTPSYASIALKLENNIWEGVPFIFRSGKALDSRRAYTKVTFKNGGQLLFNLQGTTDGIDGSAIHCSLTLCASKLNLPEAWDHVDNSAEHFHAVGPKIPNAYEVLLRSALEGDVNNFVRLPEVIESWRVWSPLLRDLPKLELSTYKHGADLIPKDKLVESKHDEL